LEWEEFFDAEGYLPEGIIEELFMLAKLAANMDKE
jgi:hypothetical protein